LNLDPASIIFEKATVIVADDVDDNSKYIKDALDNTNLTVLEANNGLEAFDLIMKIRPNVVITDIAMPGLNGFELLQKIKAEKTLKNIPVIAYSASVMNEQKEKIRQSEFSGLLIKPVTVVELYSELMKCLPYTKHEKVNSVIREDETTPSSELKDLPGLISILDNEYYNKWKTFRVRQPIGEINSFGKSLISLGMNHNSKLIQDYGADLVQAAESFNIEKILKLLYQYQEKLNSVKSILTE
jgi:CheY-like chemotaxis protein